MAATLLNYRQFNNTSEFVKLKSTGVPYPDYDSYEILGNVLTPRIYGKDLSIFEVASSGRIALTMNDIYSLDMSRDNALSNVTLATVNNDSFVLSTSNNLNLNAFNLNLTSSNVSSKALATSFSNQNGFNTISSTAEFTVTSNVTITSPGASLRGTPSNMTMTALSAININGSNNVYVTGNSNVFINANSKAVVTMSGSDGNMDMLGNQLQVFTSTTSGPSKAMSVYRDTTTNNNIVKIDGNLIITGMFETQDVTNTNLSIEDKTIQLAYPAGSNAHNEDGTLNDGAGVEINGVVSGSKTFNTDNDKVEFYKKALLWKYNQGGIDLLGTSGGVSLTTNDLSESYWDIRGGGMMFTVPKQDSSKNLYNVSYGFRINENDQFELYKRVKGLNGMYTIKRLSRWGGGAPIL